MWRMTYTLLSIKNSPKTMTHYAHTHAHTLVDHFIPAWYTVLSQAMYSGYPRSGHVKLFLPSHFFYNPTSTKKKKDDEKPTCPAREYCHFTSRLERNEHTSLKYLCLPQDPHSSCQIPVYFLTKQA